MVMVFSAAYVQFCLLFSAPVLWFCLDIVAIDRGVGKNIFKIDWVILFTHQVVHKKTSEIMVCTPMGGSMTINAMVYTLFVGSSKLKF